MSTLREMEFLDAKNKPIDGLVSVLRPCDAQSPHEEAIVRQTREIGNVDFVFFRRFRDTEGRHFRSSQVLAYVIDNSREKQPLAALADLHHKTWLQGLAPLIYVAWSTRVDILSCARKPDFWDEHEGKCRYDAAESIEFPRTRPRTDDTLRVAADISDSLNKRRRLSATRLLDGTFWETSENQRLADNDAAAHSLLIRAVVEADAEIGGAEKTVRRRLLLLMVLIAYLEDRGVFPAGHFGRYHAGVRSFRELLRVGSVEEVTSFLRYLEKTKFNGDVFSLTHDGTALSAADLESFANLVEGKTLGKQRHFWSLFDFRQIPVEVISRLYQRFVTSTNAVYTPPLLALLLLDQVMPYDRLTGRETVLDPTCGSGVFLVGAFKRLIVHWRSRHQWRRPSVEVAKSILARSIHGVEMERTAVDLTAFSLALALCDSLDPPLIWNELRFEKLIGRNLRCGDFFDPATLASDDTHAWPEKFDIVVGNPPFESKLTPVAREFDTSRPQEHQRTPDSNAAYLFLERGLQLLSAKGSICLLQPHGLLYNSLTGAFRRRLMQLARLDSVLDFVSVRGLFDGADPKTIAWHAINEPIDESFIHHLTFRRTFAVAERIGFELDHYDWHRISRHVAANDPFAWRVGLLGGGRLLDFSQRLRQMRSLSQLVQERGWEYGEGFIAGNHGVPAPFLTGKPYLPTSAFNDDGFDDEAICTLEDEFFYRPSIPERFSPPLILIKENASLPVAFWEKSSLAYRHKIVGIHAPPHQRDELHKTFLTLQSRKRFYQFCVTLNGTQALVGKATAILKTDIDRLPMPQDAWELQLAFWEDVLSADVLDYMADYVRLGQDSKLLKREASDAEVGEYAALFVRMLGSVYRNLRAADALRLTGLIAQPFYFGQKPETDWIQEDTDSLRRLVYDTSIESLRMIRVVRHYENNVILIVKPDRLRYWIRSTAIRDADDTLSDLRRQGW